MRFNGSVEDGGRVGAIVGSVARHLVGAGGVVWGGARRALHARSARRRGADAGMITSEYALGTVAACAFAALLYRVVSSDTVKGLLEGVIGKALGGQ